MEIETIKVKHSNHRGFKVINKSDFIDGVHEDYVAPKKRVRKPRQKKVVKDDNN